MKTSEVLNRAADLIEERGWVVGNNGWPSRKRPESGLCLEGGIMAALGFDFDKVNVREFAVCPAYQAVQTYLALRVGLKPSTGVPYEPLFKFNDKRERSQAEVVEVLRAAAVIEAAKEDARAEVSA